MAGLINWNNPVGNWVNNNITNPISDFFGVGQQQRAVNDSLGFKSSGTKTSASNSGSGLLSGLGAGISDAGTSATKAVNQLSDKVLNSKAGTDAALANLGTLFNAYSTSALKQNEQWNKDVMKFNQDEAAKNRQFQHDENELAWQRSESSAQKQMDFQREMYQINQDYETEMANTQYQRAVKDMRDAGINPLYAANVGGAMVPSMSAPSGASASSSGVSGSTASASNFDYSNAKNSDKSSMLKDLFGDLFSDYMTSATKILSTKMTNDTAIATSVLNGGLGLLGKMIPR